MKLASFPPITLNYCTQKRWFISELHEEGKSVSINVYGAIELAADPILQLKAWKRLGSNGAFEPDMHLEPIQFSKPVLNALNNSSMQLVLEEAYILLVAYQCVQLDRTSERGRYILSTLQDYQHTFSAYSTERYAYNPTNLNIDLLQMFLCDYMAAFGAGSEATNCYHTVIERLQQSLPPNYATLHTPVLLQKSNHHHTALHCAYKEQLSEYDHINCHIHYASLRHARHLLIHSVDPVRVLAVLQGKGDVAVAAQSQQSDVWQVMSYCLIGLCTDEHVVVDKAGMKDGAWIRIKNELDHKLLSTPVAAICRECDAILAYLHANGDNEVIHTLFTKICFPFQQLQDRYATAGTPTTGSENHLPWAGKRELMDQSRTVVASLLSIGAVELAALHCANLLHYALDIPQISAGDAESFATTGFSEAILKAELQRMVVLYPGLKLVLPLSTPHSPVDAPLRSPNVGAALSLSLLLRRISESDTLWQDFLSNSDFLSNILNVMFHSTSPVILSTPTRAFTPAAATTSADTLSSAASAGDCSDETVPASWLQEAVLLRHVMVHTLRTVVNACRCGHHQRDSDSDSDSIDGGAKCEITDPASSVGARGLFLLAYQGLGLAAESIETMAHSVESIMTITDTAQEEVKEALGELKYMLRDSTVPSLYQDLLRRASSELASIPPFQRASHFPLTFEEPTCEIGSADQTCTVAVRAEEQQQEPPKRRRIKVAFLSFFFRRHPVGRLLAKIIVKLNHTMFDVHIVTTQENKKQDDVSAYLHRHISPDKWIYITHNMATASNLIRQQQFDVLVFGDVFMDANMAHFATLRLAPVQVCFWGHPFTTGYEHMDYFITSDAFEQKQAQFKYY